MPSSNGLISPADLLTTLDALAGWCKYVVLPHGQGLASEASAKTITYQAGLAQTKILGDGTGTNPGLANANLQSGLTQKLATLYTNSRYEVTVNMSMRALLAEVVQELSASTVLPKYLVGTTYSQWNMSSSSTQALDAHIQRLNATGASVPATPVGTPTLTATTGGSLPSTLAGSAPVMVYTFVGASDWLESQPSPVSAQVALSGANNAYTIGGMSTVPAGVTKIRLYRSLFGATSPLIWDRDVSVSAGAAPTTLKFTQSDINLRQDVSPPLWAQCMMLPEAALLHAICNMSAGATSQSGFVLSASGLLSPTNVVLNPISGLLGYNNPGSSGQFAQWASAASTFGTINTVNDTTQGLQGFAGAFGVQARTTATLDVNASISSIGYSYVTAASPLTPLTATIAGPLTLNLATGSTVSLAIPAGQMVKSITSMTVTGSSTGTFVLEAIPLRTI